MISNHEATPYKWRELEEFSSDDANACVLELRARVEALEAKANHSPGPTKMVPPPVATDEELDDIWHKRVNAPGGTFVACRRAIYNLGIEHGQASSREVADPAPVAGGLVDRVARAVTLGSNPNICVNIWSDIAARTAIIEVATWLREQGTSASGWAMRLEQEAGR